VEKKEAEKVFDQKNCEDFPFFSVEYVKKENKMLRRNMRRMQKNSKTSG
jgi:hypothetical protein